MMPFSEGRAAFAGSWLRPSTPIPTTLHRAVADLFERGARFGRHRERNAIALRMSRDQAVLLNDLRRCNPEVAQLPSVARVMTAAGADEVKSEGSDSEEQTLQTGDDDSGEPEDFYADALEDVWPGQP
jgi:hypothetical protein